MEVVHLEKTCDGCPAQWEGYLEDEREIYCRYLWGRLTIQVSYEPNGNALDGDLIYDEQLGDAYDGLMNSSELLSIMENCGFVF